MTTNQYVKVNCRNQSTTQLEISDEQEINHISNNVNENKESNNILSHKKRYYLICLSILLLIIIALCITLLSIFVSNNEDDNSKQNYANCMNGNKVVIISLDGYSFNYLNKTKYNISTPNMDYYFKELGVSATNGLQVTYPTKTYSSHYSIITGLYPQYNGIISNSFYDPVIKRYYDIRNDKEDPSGIWYKGEPIYNTAKLKNLNTAAFYYPGSLANCSARYPNISGYPKFHYDKYVYNWLFMDQINKSIELLTSNDSIYDLVMLYMYQPDYYSHMWYGENNTKIKLQIEQIDTEIGIFIDMLKVNDLFYKTDIILISDHGITQVQKWDDYISNNISEEESTQIIINSTIFNFSVIEAYVRSSSFILIYLYDDQDVNYYMDLFHDSIMSNKQHCRISENGYIPYEFNGGYNKRVPTFIVEAFIGYTFYSNISGVEYKNRVNGNHGYNNSEQDMKGIFFATGPSFKTNYSIHYTYDSINLYRLFCKLLCNVEPNPDSNGSIAYSNNILASKGTHCCVSVYFCMIQILFVVLLLMYK
eukprot:251453_1